MSKKEEKMFSDFKKKMFKELDKFSVEMQKTAMYKDNPNFAEHLIADYLNFESIGRYYFAGDCKHKVKSYMNDNLKRVTKIYQDKYTDKTIN